MKKFALCFLAVQLLVPVSAFGQNHKARKSSTVKPTTISGLVSEDGNQLITKSGELLAVTNPVMLVGHEKQQVKVKCETSADHRIRVVSLKVVAAPARYHFNPHDSAFRR